MPVRETGLRPSHSSRACGGPPPGGLWKVPASAPAELRGCVSLDPVCEEKTNSRLREPALVTAVVVGGCVGVPRRVPTLDGVVLGRLPWPATASGTVFWISAPGTESRAMERSPWPNSLLKECFEPRFESFSFGLSASKRSQLAWFPSFDAGDSGRGVPKRGPKVGRMNSSTGC